METGYFVMIFSNVFPLDSGVTDIKTARMGLMKGGCVGKPQVSFS